MKNSKFENIDYLFQQLKSGERIALSKAITLLESRRNEDIEKAFLLMKLIDDGLPQKQTFRLGVTGVPGVGKSSIIEKLGLKFVEAGKKVAVLSIDPSSAISGGSILGDKTRMEHLSMHTNAFVRPSASSSKLGGVGWATYESVLLCEFAGYDVIIIETVGVGQSEFDVRNMVDFLLYITQAHGGDDIQAIKRGILEMIDGVIINKKDLVNDAAVRETQLLYQQRSTNQQGLKLVLPTSTEDPESVKELYHKLSGYMETSDLMDLRNKQKLSRLRKHVEKRMWFELERTGLLNEYKDKLFENKLSEFDAAEHIINKYLNK